jgi:guanosine-3',5'-bis(diphosphate) 3'-pyrophosphohydrolase
MDLPLVLRALEFAAEKHRGQVRKDADATPYIQHPIALATLLWQAGIQDAEVLAAAILHDTVEDTPTTHDELEKHFNRTVADLVAEVTDDKRQPKAVKQGRSSTRPPPRASDQTRRQDIQPRDVAKSPPQG